MRKKIAAMVLAILSIAGVIGAATVSPAGAQGTFWQDWAVYGPSHDYVVRIAWQDFGDWGKFRVETFRYAKNGVYQGKEADIWFRDSACPTVEQDGTSPMVAFRSTNYWDRQACGWTQRSPELVNETDVPPGQAHLYGYWCYFSCSLVTINGDFQYGYWNPLQRGVYDDPILRLF